MAKTIVCPIDGSDHAERAVDWALDLAAALDARLTLLYVVPRGEAPPELRHMATVEHLVRPPSASGEPGPGEPTGASARLLKEVEIGSAKVYREVGGRLIEAVERRARARGIKEVAGTVREGDPAAQILATAKEQGADLIVMGGRGAGALEGLLLGSVSNKVCQLAPCACLTVK